MSVSNCTLTSFGGWEILVLLAARWPDASPSPAHSCQCVLLRRGSAIHLQMRNLYQEAIWLYRGDRKPNQVSQGSSLPRNPWNILPLIGCWPVGQSDLDTTKLLSGERKCQLPLKCLNEIKPSQVIPLMVLLLTNLLIKSHHHVQVSASKSSRYPV